MNSNFYSIYFRHTINNGKEKKPTNHKRYSAPPLSNQPKNRFRSPFSNTTTTSTDENGTNGNHSEEYESPQKVKYYQLLLFFL